MYYTDKVIRGETALKAFLAKFRPGQSIQWMETIGHIAEIRIELFYAMGPQDNGQYSAYYWLMIPSNNPDKGFHDWSKRRQEIYEGIKTGKITGR